MGAWLHLCSSAPASAVRSAFDIGRRATARHGANAFVSDLRTQSFSFLLNWTLPIGSKKVTFRALVRAAWFIRAQRDRGLIDSRQFAATLDETTKPSGAFSSSEHAASSPRSSNPAHASLTIPPNTSHQHASKARLNRAHSQSSIRPSDKLPSPLLVPIL
jgi:hypothetical protein